VPYTPDFFLWQQASNEIRFISSPPQTNQKILMMIFFQIEKERRKKKRSEKILRVTFCAVAPNFYSEFRIELQSKSQDVYLAISPLPLSLSRLICHVFMKLKENR